MKEKLPYFSMCRVVALVGLEPETIRSLIEKGDFPEPHKVEGLPVFDSVKVKGYLKERKKCGR